NIDLRKDIEDEIRKKHYKVKEIRFREIGFELRDKRKINLELKLKKLEYKASDGKEIFLQVVNKDNILFGLLRLRLEKDKNLPATIRELHIYGPSLKLLEHDEEKYQHKGLGKQLMLKAEEIAKKEKRKIIRVISGVGVRQYYYSLGYKLDKDKIYVEKEL
ncbi:MAG: GNAT family N-acetyltransferase, partial [Nanoarchaeota archaeon]|nr:GNAT family N-acetyltransferase [Nanoarchaeota archaeon]